MAEQEEKSIVIMGGGPAGVFTACGLIDLGLRATIITRPRPFPAWEGLSDRPVNSLRHFGFHETLASIGPMVAREAHWNGTSQIQNREYILNRQLFDQALLRDAKNKGVQVIEGRIDAVNHPDQNDGQKDRQNPGWRISYTPAAGEASGSATMKADFLVEARGREAGLGRRMKDGGSVTAPATSALLKSYHISRDLEAMTSVASFAEGWAWFLRDGEGTAILQIFISSDKGQLPPKAGLEACFAQLVNQIPQAVDWLRGAEAHDDRVSVRTAAPTKTLPVGGDDFLVVGDGSLALDPLSGNGIFYAIGSGLAAAPVINTLLHRPEQADLALQFHQERIDLAFKGGCLMGREFYASEEQYSEEPYWKARSNWPLDEDTSHPDPLSKEAEICQKPVVRDGFIELENVVMTADHPRGVWQIDGVPLVRLLDLIRAGSCADEVNATELGATPAHVASARNWLVLRNLVARGEAA